MSKRIIIGVGGIGTKVVFLTAKRLTESFGSFEKSGIALLSLDTEDQHTKIINESKKYTTLGKDYRLSKNQCCHITPPDLQVISQYQQHTRFAEIYNLNLLAQCVSTSRDPNGASCIRQLGSLSLAFNLDSVKRAVRNATEVAVDNEDGSPSVYVTIVGSINGGTASGIFIDLGYLIHALLPNASITAQLIMMPSNLDETRLQENAYAALLELNALKVIKFYKRDRLVETDFKPIEGCGNPERLFDFVYITETETAYQSISLDELISLNSSKILYDAGAIRNEITARHSNSIPDRITAIPYSTDPNARHSADFFSFGLSKIRYPYPEIVQKLATQVALDYLLEMSTTNIPLDVFTELKNSLTSLGLTEVDLTGISPELFVNIQKHTTQILADSNKQPRESMVSYIKKSVSDYIAVDFSSMGISEMYDTLFGEMAARLRGVNKALIEKTEYLVLHYGLSTAESFLQILESYISEKRKIFNGEASTQKLNVISKNLGLRYSDLQNIINQWPSFNRRNSIAKSQHNLQETLTKMLTCNLECSAYPYANKQLDSIEKMIQELKSTLMTNRLMLSRLEDIIGKAKKYSDEFLKKPSENTSYPLKIDQECEKILSEFSREALAFRCAEILTKQNLFKSPSLTPVDKDPAENISAVLIQELESYLNDRTTNKTALNCIPTLSGDELRKTVSDMLNKSQVLLQLTNAQQGLGDGTPPVNILKFALVPHYTNDATAKEVGRVILSLDSDVNIVENNSSDDIVFLQEVSTFPVRAIRSLDKRRNAYEKHIKANLNEPLHTRRSFDPELPSLYLTNMKTAYENRQYQDSFLFALAKQNIRKCFSRQEGQERYAFFFKNKQNNEIPIFLGETLLASASLHDGQQVEDAYKNEIQRLSEQEIGSFREYSNRQKFALELAKVAKLFLNEVDGDIANPDYLFFSNKIDDMFARYNLPALRDNKSLGLTEESEVIKS